MNPATVAPPADPPWTRRLAEALAEGRDRPGGEALEAARWRQPAGDAGLLPAAVLAAILEGPGGPGILLTRRRDDLGRHAGQVALPGGRQDASDSGPEQAALREAEEEVGLVPSAVRILGRLPRYPTVTGFLVTPVVAYVPEPPRLAPHPTEVAEIFAVPVGVLLDEGRWRDRPLEFRGRRVAHREMYWEGRRVWGVTAGILRMLLPPLAAALAAAPS